MGNFHRVHVEYGTRSGVNAKTVVVEVDAALGAGQMEAANRAAMEKVGRMRGVVRVWNGMWLGLAERPIPKPSDPKTFTAFCQETDGTGTVWIAPVKAKNAEQAIDRAQRACAKDWGFKRADVHVLGLAEGDVKILFWEDVCDAG